MLALYLLGYCKFYVQLWMYSISAYDMSCYDCNNGWDLCKETGITKPSLHNVAKCKSPCYMQRQKINGK